MGILRDTWAGCYPSKWKGMIVPDAIKHPAKYSSKLIARIYDHMQAEGWLHPGDMILDPFGGVGLGAFDAQRIGCRWRGIELEVRFAELGNANIALWNKRFSLMPHWCPDAVLYNGDSRKLLTILQEHVGQCVSSPPYAETINSTSNGIDWERAGRPDRTKPSAARLSPGVDGGLQYGTTPGQLGAMKAEGFDQAVSSPPYAEARIGQESGQEQCGRGDQYGATEGQLGAMQNSGFDMALSSPPYGGMPVEKNSKSIDREKQYAVYRASGGGQSFEAFCRTQEMHSQDYGDSDGQLSHMPTGDFDHAISSPPYNKPFSQEHPGTRGGQRGVTPSEEGAFVRYGNTEGQLEGMPDGNFDDAVSSPPFLQARGGTPEPRGEGAIDAALYQRHSAGNASAHGYGESEGQLSSMSEEGFDQAVSSPPFEKSLATNLHRIRDIAGIEQHSHRKAGQVFPSEVKQEYGDTEGNLGNDVGDSFWLSARQIVDQVYAALKPGGHAVWVVKGFVKNKQVVDFPGQWQQLCEAAGFETLHIHQALLTNHHGTSYTLDGEQVHHKTEAKSFFRRNGEQKARAARWWETAGLTRDCQAAWIWQAKTIKWSQWRADCERHPERTIHKPRAFLVRGKAQSLAYEDAGSPEVEIATSIDYEVVICMQKRGTHVNLPTESEAVQSGSPLCMDHAG